MSLEHSSDGAEGQDAPQSRLNFDARRTLPIILQNEAAECGLACLAMIAHYFDHKASMPALRRKFAVSLKGMTLTRIVEMADSLGLQGRPLKAEVDEIGQLQTPCILHWNLNHFVVLKRVVRSNVVIIDPAVGERTLSMEEVSKRFTGVALELSRGPNFQRKAPEPSLSLRALAGSFPGLARALAQIFGMALVLELFVLLAPLFSQLVVDQVLADGDKELLTFLGGSFTLLLVLQVVVTAMRTWSVMWLSSSFNIGWTANVFQHLMKLPQAYFLKRHLGDIVSRFSAIGTIQQTLTSKFVEVILDGVMALLTLIVMVIYCPLLCAVAIAAAAVYAALRSFYFRIYREASLGQVILAAKQQSAFMEAARGVQTLRLYNQGAAQTARYINTAIDTVNCSIAVQKLNLVFSSLSMLTSGVQRIVILWVGAWLAIKGDFTAGMLMAFIAYADQFAQRSSSLIDYVIELRLLRLQGERLADIVLTPPEPFTSGSYAGPLPEPSIAFRNVTYRYAEGEPFVLKDVSFTVKPGESVAVVGPSGCGKSTLARVMLGLLDPLVGQIEVGGVNIHHLGKANYRSMIGTVMQDDTLFAGSVADNISFFDGAATPDRIEEAAQLAGLHDDIISMPMGYHTLVGDMGSALSGGQRQRLFLARALYAKPAILILDEATSHLDVARERSVNASLKAMNVTRIIIAHRPETIASADRVLLLHGGKVREIARPVAGQEPLAIAS